MWRTLSLSLAVSRCPCVTRGSAERRTGSPGRRLGRPELRTACDVWRSLLHWSFVCVCVGVCVYVCVWGFHISVEAESAFRPPTQAACKDHRMLEASFSTHGTLDLTCKRWPSPKEAWSSGRALSDVEPWSFRRTHTGGHECQVRS